jgi:Tfp pilus assembly PilM family ATPase
MFFSQKSNGYFIDANDHAVMLARTSGLVAPFTIEEVRECPSNDPVALTEMVKLIQPKKSADGYLHAAVAVYPAKRIVRRHTLEPRRLKEPDYLNEVMTQQLRVEPSKFTMMLINATDGADYDLIKANQKDALFCGLPSDDIVALQDSFLACGIYPERIELGSVSLLGALADYLSGTKTKTPTLMLEVGLESTQSFIVSAAGVEASRPIQLGLDSMVPVVQKELGLKDEEAAKRLFYSNTFDFTGMGPLLVKRLLKELQSSIGFYEVQTGQSVGQVICTQLMPKLAWLEAAIATGLGIASLKVEPAGWLMNRQITLSDSVSKSVQETRWLGLLSLMARYNIDHAHQAEEKK